MGPPLISHKQIHARKQGHATATAPVLTETTLRIYTKKHQRDSGRWVGPWPTFFEAAQVLACGVVACPEALGLSSGRMSSIIQFNSGRASWLPGCADAWLCSALQVNVPQRPEFPILWDVKRLTNGSPADLTEAMLATNNCADTTLGNTTFFLVRAQVWPSPRRLQGHGVAPSGSAPEWPP